MCIFNIRQLFVDYYYAFFTFYNAFLQNTFIIIFFIKDTIKNIKIFNQISQKTILNNLL